MKNKKGQYAPAIVGIVFVLFVITMIILMMGIDTVDASHKGIMVNFGTIKGVMNPGIKWTGLFTHVYSYDMRLRKAHIAMSGDNYAPDKTMQSVSMR